MSTSALTTETSTVRSRVRRTSTVVGGSTPIKKRGRRPKADGADASESDASMISVSEAEIDDAAKLRDARARAESITKQIEEIKRADSATAKGGSFLSSLVSLDLLFFAPFKKNIIVPILVTLLAALLFWAARDLAMRSSSASPLLNANADLKKEVERIFTQKVESVTPELSAKMNAEIDRRFAEMKKKDEEQLKKSNADLATKISALPNKENLEEIKKEVKALQSQLSSADQKAQLADIVKKSDEDQNDMQHAPREILFLEKRLSALESAPKSVGEAATRDQVTKAVAAELSSLEKKVLKDIDTKVVDGTKPLASKDDLKKSFEDLSNRIAKLSAEKAAPHEHPLDEPKIRNIVKSLIGEITPPPVPSGVSASEKQTLEANIMSAVELRLRNALADLQAQQQQHQPQRFNIEDQRSVIAAWIADALKQHSPSPPATAAASSSSTAASIGGVSEDRVRAIVAEALEIFAADRVALADFASHSGGASVVVWRSSQTYKPASGLLGFLAKANPPHVLLEPSLEPSKCWAFKGAQGFVTIKLVEPIQIGAVTIDHISDRVAYSIASAPKDFEVFGLTHDEEEKEKAVSLGKFRYSLDAHRATQTFNIDQSAKGANKKFSHMLVEFKSNHGNQEYTCVYRVRVHSAAQINALAGK